MLILTKKIEPGDIVLWIYIIIILTIAILGSLLMVLI